MVGSFESSVPIVCFSVLCLSSVFQSGIIVRMELYSSSIFILDSKRASDRSSEGVFFRESYTVLRIVFLINFWYSGFLWTVGEHLKIPFPLLDSVISRVME